MSRSDGSATVYMGKIYIAGGLNDQMIESSVEFYDLTAKTWSLIMPTPRTSLGFVALDDALYDIGGNNGFERLQSVEKYDMRHKSWQMVANMLSKRSTFATAVIENSIYVICGYNGQTPTDSLSQIWTPTRCRWFATKLSHNSPRAYHGIQVPIIYDMVYVIGGTDGINNLDIDSCVQYFHLSIQRQHRLSNTAFNFIKANFCDVIYKCMDFPELSADELTVLIASDDLNVKSEQTVYEAIIHWIQWSANERSGLHLYPLLKNLRYARLDIEFIENTVAKNGLIVEDQDSQQLVNKFVDTFRTFIKKKDGYGLYVGLHPEAIRPRVPHEIAIVFGGWQEGIPSTMLKIIYELVYVIDGTDGINILKSVQCFDTITKRWYDRQDMNTERCYVNTVVVDGNIYAMGGHNGQHRIKSCEKYDPQTKVWTKIQDMNMSRSDGSATVYMGKIYIAGGLNDQMIESSVEFYDLTAKTWSLIMPTPRTSLGFVALDDALYDIGGNNGFERLQSVEKYDIKLKSWQMVANMLSKRSTFATAVIENSIYVIGGYNGQTLICSVEKYDSLSQIWTPARCLNHDHSGLAVCVASGLSTVADFTFIGRNELKLRNNYDNKDLDNKIGSVTLWYILALFLLSSMIQPVKGFDFIIGFDKDAEMGTTTSVLMVLGIGACLVAGFLTTVYCIHERYRVARHQPTHVLPVHHIQPSKSFQSFVYPNNNNIFVKEIERISSVVNRDDSIPFANKNKEMLRQAHIGNRFYNGSLLGVVINNTTGDISSNIAEKAFKGHYFVGQSHGFTTVAVEMDTNTLKRKYSGSVTDVSNPKKKCTRKCSDISCQ
ncbi:kelch-like protein 10 [Oppia nitens]|uniref:kelch-like protein 10 n=1 Tax=Oppia nitens TaxID=1686743 RepID=UPI0023DCB5C6|nr:kelch-like protein 10 [Oppia nitens]XP_054156338.1 kelch-like protein 10 [Oppia nitens]